MIKVVADIGGTYARFAHVKDHQEKLTNIVKLRCSSFKGILDLLKHYLSNLDDDINMICLAIACPTTTDVVNLTNIGWSFSQSALAFELGVPLLIINDFTAQSLSINALNENDFIVLHQGEAEPGAPILVIGPGTGLGVGVLIRSGNYWLPVPTEGGHVSFSPMTELEIKIFDRLKSLYGHVSAERIVSGPGLQNLFRIMGFIEGKEISQWDSLKIVQAAKKGDLFALRVTSVFFEIFATTVGNACLTIGARGGVVIAGGVIPKMIGLIQKSSFLTRLKDKGRVSDYLSHIPVRVIMDDTSGLHGARLAMENPNFKGFIMNSSTSIG